MLATRDPRQERMVMARRLSVLVVSLWFAVLGSAALAGQAPAAPEQAGAQAGQQTPAPQQPPIDLLWRTETNDPGADDVRLTWLGVNAGGNQDGNLTFDGQGTFFAPFGRRSAAQLGGTYAWYRHSREGQLDLALENRVDRLQLGLFTSVRYVNDKWFDSGGRALSQAGGAVEYLLPRGRVGIFGTGALRDRAQLGRRIGGRTLLEGRLRLVDQFGISAEADLNRRAEVEGHLAFLKPHDRGRTTAGSIRFVYPVTTRWDLTAEAAWNPYLVASSTQGRFTVGIRMRDVNSGRADADTRSPSPLEIPAAKYQVLEREVPQ
jgi:hypothetical protein